MFEDIVVKDTVKPTDWELTSQKQTSRPQVLDRGKKAMQAAATVHRILATVAVKRRAAENLVRPGNERHQLRNSILTVGNIEDNCASNEQRDNLDGISDGFELSGHRGSESHVADDDRGEGVDNAVGDGTVDEKVRARSRQRDVSIVEIPYAAKTLMKIRMVLGSVKPLTT